MAQGVCRLGWIPRMAGDRVSAEATYSERVRLRRKRERGSHDRAVIDAILDEALVAHLGFVEPAGGHPVVVPVLHARSGDVVYLHGSAAGRAMRTLAAGAEVCLTVSLIDGLVLARAAMHHSANYRSVMLLGRAEEVVGEEQKLAASRALVEHIAPGRWSDVRPPSGNELRATAILALPIAEASAKIRTGPPLDDAADHARATWAGVLPLHMVPGAPEPDPLMPAGRPAPEYVSAYARPAGLPRR
jgi:nitroimidazol reductase NimA-like FMN-containing flavoprotein (pyridoxamine 5'-phosphate oxidase superfamily)